MFLFSRHLKIKQLHLALHLLLTWHHLPQLWCQGWCLHHLWWCQLFPSTLLQVCPYGMSFSNSVPLKRLECTLCTKEVRQICNTVVWKLERKRPLGTNGEIILKWTKKWDAKVQTGFTWHNIRASGFPLWSLRHFAFYKRWKISWTVEQQSVSQIGLCSIELVK